MNLEDYFKYYIQGSDHYLIPKDVFMELFNEMINWKEESKQLKNNWNELKEIIKKKFVAQGGFTSYEWNDLLNELLDKMQEMEKNYGNVEDNT